MTISRSAKTVLAALMLALTVMLIMPACAFADDTEELPEADRFGQVKLYSTITPGKVLKDSYHFTDDWFSDVDPKTENKDLALLSMQFVAAAVDNDSDGLGGDFLRELGFRNIGYYGNTDPVEADCNYTYGETTLDDNTTLIAVAIQSYAFDKNGKAKGWPQNFEVNGDSEEGEHYMLSTVADNMLEKLEKLSDDREVRYWITGQSRGGALANLIAAKLPARLGTRNLGIFAYTFEAPNVVQPENAADRERIRNDYGYIHNYVCSDDPVTMIPPWGMVRYGVDHELDTIETNEGLEKELEKLGSDAKLPE